MAFIFFPINNSFCDVMWYEVAFDIFRRNNFIDSFTIQRLPDDAACGFFRCGQIYQVVRR